jgi:hypothetical protein
MNIDELTGLVVLRVSRERFHALDTRARRPQSCADDGLDG